MTRGPQQRKIWIVFTWRHGGHMGEPSQSCGDELFSLFATNAPCLPPKIFAFALFPVSLGTALIPRRNRKQSLCKICGVGGKGNKVYYGRCANGEL